VFQGEELVQIHEIQKVRRDDEFHRRKRSVNHRPTAHEIRACGGPHDGRSADDLEAAGRWRCRRRRVARCGEVGGRSGPFVVLNAVKDRVASDPNRCDPVLRFAQDDRGL